MLAALKHTSKYISKDTHRSLYNSQQTGFFGNFKENIKSENRLSWLKLTRNVSKWLDEEMAQNIVLRTGSCRIKKKHPDIVFKLIPSHLAT